MKRKGMFIMLLTAAILAVVVMSASAQPAETNSYVIMMEGDPVVAYDGGIVGLEGTKPGPGEKINPNDAKVKRYVNHLEAKQNESLRQVKARNQKIYNYVYSFNGYAADLTDAQAAAVKKQADVLQVFENEVFYAETSTTPDFLGLTAEDGLWDMGVDGEDVIIGIVDSGIWPESMSFSDRTGTNPNGKGGKLSYHQIPGWNGKCVPGEEFNASMCNQKLIGAQYFNACWGGNAGIDADRPWEFNSARDYGGHGTHTASTAGGNNGVPAEVSGIDLGSVSGMAPRARISAYKALWDTGAGSSNGCSIDLVAAIDQAVADGVDVINYSISGSTTSVANSVELAFLFAADAGVFVATSAGNSGPGASTVAHNAPWTTTVAAGTHDRYYAGEVTLGDGSVYEGASIDSSGAGPADLVYGEDVVLSGEDPDEARRCFPGTLDPAQVEGKIVLCDRGTIARVDKSYAVWEAGGIGMIHANVSPSSINADLHFVPTVHVDEVAGDAIRTYVHTDPAPMATLTGGVFQSVEAPDVASFSSRGPALAANSNILKPDIMAPGVDILAAVAPPGNAGRNFDFYSGTSMSSPHIAGLAALIMQAHPDWTPMMVKSALMTTASTMTNDDNPIDGDPFGYGAGQVVPNSAADPGLVYNSSWNSWLAYLCGASSAVSANTCNILESLGYSSDASDLNYPSIAISQLAGSRTVERTVTNVGPAGTYNVSVDAPAGVDVTVEPASLTLGEGESASYEVTFTSNASVVPDMWTFGSLTWSHGPHHVTSPIALYPVAIGAPAELLETGESGSDSFDVTFGYTGDYTAAPHGLVAPE
ncbi:MAG: S8 family serine peptidase, partial [Chloroflexota bacterium]